MVSQVNFFIKTQRAIGTSNTQIGSYVVNTGIQTMVLTMTLANITGLPVSANLYHNDGTSNTAIVDGAPIPVGGSLVVNKIVLQNGHSVFVSSNAASSLDATMSIVEMS